MKHDHRINIDRFVDLSFEEDGHTTHHQEHRLALLTDGTIEMVYGSKINIVAPAIIIIPPGMPHRPLKAKHAAMYLVSFCVGCLGIDEDSLLMQPYRQVINGSQPIVALDTERLPFLTQLLEALSTESQQSGTESTPLIRSYLSILFGDIYRKMGSTDNQSPVSKLTSEALRFIHQHSHQSISLKEVAAAVHRVPAHVAATVKKETGSTVGEWICQARIKQASYRLSHTTLSVQNVATELDWKDITHFIRQFKKVTGHTPAQWRKQQAIKVSGEPENG